ncbi:MAG: PIG-L deacetylase family protein [Thermomicrobiales bacterium]
MAREPAVVISPHLDDGVFGCGELLASHPGSVVVTTFAGRPARYDGVTVWDAAAGFQTGDDVIAERREEDRAALAVLAARPIWLDFQDRQYGPPPATEAVTTALEGAIARVNGAAVYCPLGLFHDDHKQTFEAVLPLLQRMSERAWFAYEDALYRNIPHLLEERLTSLPELGVAATLAGASGNASARKRRAMRCYQSQVRALTAPGYPGVDDAFAPERYYRLALAPAANDSERLAGVRRM